MCCWFFHWQDFIPLVKFEKGETEKAELLKTPSFRVFFVYFRILFNLNLKFLNNGKIK